MAGYTTPKTWLATDFESVVDWNTYVRDNLNSIRQFMYLPSQYATFSFNLVTGANIVYTSPDLLPAAPAEPWNFFVMVVMGIQSNFAGQDVCTVTLKDRNSNNFTQQPPTVRIAQGVAAYTPHSILGYRAYSSILSLIPKFSITLQLTSGTAGVCAGIAVPYATPVSQ